MNCLSVNTLSWLLSGRRKTENNFGISWAVHHRCEVLMGDYLSDRFWPNAALPQSKNSEHPQGQVLPIAPKQIIDLISVSLKKKQ